MRTLKHPGGGPTLKEAFVGRVRGKVLLLLCFMYLITYIDRVNIATAAPFIQKDLGVSNTELGIALCAFSIPYAFFQIFGGLIGDKYGSGRCSAWSASCGALATIATSFVGGLVILFAARRGSHSASVRAPRSPPRRMPWPSGCHQTVVPSARGSRTRSPG